MPPVDKLNCLASDRKMVKTTGSELKFLKAYNISYYLIHVLMLLYEHRYNPTLLIHALY